MPQFGNSSNEGALFLGIAKGMQRGQERQQDLAHKKELLKFEQSKIKLMEDELKLKGETTLYDTMYKKELAETERLNPNRRPKPPEAVKVSPGETVGRMEESGFVSDFTADLTPQQKGVGGDRQPSADIQMVDRLIQAGVPEKQALDSVMQRDREGLIRLLLATAVRTPQLPGMPGPDIQGILKQYDKLISGKANPLDKLFEDLPPLPGGVQEELQ